MYRIDQMAGDSGMLNPTPRRTEIVTEDLVEATRSEMRRAGREIAAQSSDWIRTTKI